MPTEQPIYSSQYSLLGPRFAAPEQTVSCPDPSARCRKDVIRPCLLSDEGFQRNFVFEGGGIGLSDRWRRINVVLLLPSPYGNDNFRPRPGTFNPFVHISHTLKTFCTLRTPGVVPETRPITFTTALKFATAPATSSGSANPPPFLQLYDESGEPRLPDPLPLYSPARKKKGPVIEVEEAPVLPSVEAMLRESSNEDSVHSKPFNAKHRASPDLGLPGSTALRDGAVSPPSSEEYPKSTIGEGSGSQLRAESNYQCEPAEMVCPLPTSACIPAP